LQRSERTAHEASQGLFASVAADAAADAEGAETDAAEAVAADDVAPFSGDDFALQPTLAAISGSKAAASNAWHIMEA
jgi:hypothetical protein